MNYYINQKISCVECGSEDYESFSDSRYSGMRCKKCGHEKKELHQHLRPQTEGITYGLAQPCEVKF
jgi:anaerobic ribonucleoside-triphosphate reductase